MSNFFARQPVPLTPNPEPAGYDVLRYMLMNRAMGQFANPYGLSPQGAANFGGFNQGNRPGFNPYGHGFGPGGPRAAPPPMPPPQPPQGMGGGMGGGMGMPPPGGMGGGQSMGGMTPQGSGGSIMQILMQLLGARQQQGMGGGMGAAPMPPSIAPRPQGMGGMTPQGSGGSIGGLMGMGGMTSQPRATMPVDQQMGGYDGTTVGYGGRPAGGFSGAGQGHFGHQAPQNVMALMRALGQVPRPHPMGMGMMPQASAPAMGRPPVNPMGAMRMPRGRF